MRYQAVSDVGCVRQNNEDMILVDGLYVRDESAEGICSNFAVVADGMGGANGGELASDIACQEFETWFFNLPESMEQYALKEEINRFAQHTHALINRRGCELEGFLGMGTTLVGVFRYEGRWWWLNIGDSRLYLLRKGDLIPVSTDHSMRNLSGNPILPSNLIYNCLGNGDDFEPFADFGPLDLMHGDRLLLCSDGLSDMISDAEILSIMQANACTPPLAQRLVDAAKIAGGKDNVSVITLDFNL